jgi:hypothetical protein
MVTTSFTVKTSSLGILVEGRHGFPVDEVFTGKLGVTTSCTRGGDIHGRLGEFHLGFTESASPVESTIPLGKKCPWGV